MLVIELRFPAGRFHATPWGRHVNEGAVEWPPSPWRLLRALIAVWHRKCSALPEGLVRSLIGRLCTLPEFHLPPAAVGHTRHYLPEYQPDKTNLVFDTFVTLDPAAPLVIVWPELELSTEESAALEQLLTELHYFGRAESWVQARLCEEWSGEPNCRVANGHASDTSRERVEALAPVTPEAYGALRDPARAAILEAHLADARAQAAAKGKDPSTVKLSRKKQQELTAYLADDLFTALHADTGDLRRQGWSQPPGSRKVHYLRPAPALHARPHPVRRGPVQRPTVARYALAGVVLPPLTEALAVGEQLRRALMSWSDAAPLFAGKDDEGPLQGHRHAFILPADDDNDGRLDHVVVYAAKGFGARECRALGALRALRQPGGRPDLQLVLTTLGEPPACGGFRPDEDETPLLATSRVWESRTPFVLVRHPKRHRDGALKLREDGTWIDGPEDQLRRELARRRLPPPVRVEPLPATHARGRDLRWLQFRRHRQRGGGRQGPPAAFGFRVEFAEAVIGPIALGYGAHFGLGQFAATQ